MVFTRYLQAIRMMLFSVSPVFDRYPKYAWIMKQLCEPERAVQVRSKVSKKYV